ncbi:hypothetical protein GUITHDRAFT_107735 [Guillardia theta CCMP2712]|uniref:TRUD domain-containing protein n=1 Tax=Guillardia theta (strain CCMP2712) TaxID=905079 RepID=L1JDY8_GUITC|nr:hypothetical protein GUITHDRAFT_107735 [Guillardia theta CCMP2712]EKX46532.1 hypothetical protein GUITHDRAFT_107735 [Guillardia theta CCMP2712]|eukprot:XP_005833512.1 hypothetical protein GUITHDRAFT_107735 [Guillardia theta CCMP2712]
MTDFDATCRFSSLGPHDVGISEFADSRLLGIGGVIKCVPSDFIVQEISKEKIISSHGELENPNDTVVKASRDEDDCYFQFTLHKTMIDTFEVISELSSALNVPFSNFSVFGLKDSFAITTQEMTVYGVSKERLEEVNEFDKFIISNIREADAPQRPGQHYGNKFTIVVRDLKADDEHTQVAMKSLTENGFVNYLGMQRFGKGSSETELMGRLLLMQDYITAVDALLRPPHEDERHVKELRAWNLAWEAWTHARDATTARNIMPKSKRQECDVLDHLVFFGKKGLPLHEICRKTVLSIPLQKRMLMVHAYFGKIWNVMASERLRMYGIDPVVGDLVYNDDVEDSTDVNDVESSDTELEDFSWTWSSKTNTKVLSAQDIESKRYTRFDLILPFPAGDAAYPNNEMSNLYRMYLSYDLGVSQIHFIERSWHGNKLFLRPVYRHLFSKPEEFTWSIANIDKSCPEDMRTQPIHEDPVLGNMARKAAPLASFPNMEALKVLEMKFTLKSGQYATMMLRELIKNRAGMCLNCSEMHTASHSYQCKNGRRKRKHIRFDSDED